MEDIDNTHASFSITPYQPAHRGTVRWIIDTTLGVGYLGNLDIWVTQDQMIPRVAVSNDGVVGFGIAQMATPDFVEPIMGNLGHEQSNELLQAVRDNTLGVIQTVVVAPGHQRSGVGSRLGQELETELWIAGAEWFLAPTWESPEGINSKVPLLQAGYSELVKIPAYWQTACESGQFICPSRTTSCQWV